MCGQRVPRQRHLPLPLHHSGALRGFRLALQKEFIVYPLVIVVLLLQRTEMTSRLQPSDVVAAFMQSVQDPKKRLDQDYREMALRDLVTMLENNAATRAGFTLDREEKLVSEILALLLRDSSMDVRQHAVKAVVLLFMFVSSSSQDSICDKVMLMLGERDDKVTASDHGPSPSLLRDAATLTLKGIVASLAQAVANSESISRPLFFTESYNFTRHSQPARHGARQRLKASPALPIAAAPSHAPAGKLRHDAQSARGAQRRPAPACSRQGQQSLPTAL